MSFTCTDDEVSLIVPEFYERQFRAGHGDMVRAHTTLQIVTGRDSDG